jgi:hypothetical protein
VKLSNARVTGGYAGALGPDITALMASGRMNQARTLEAMLRGAEAPETALEKWRDADGNINVSELSLMRKNAKGQVAGTLTLDEAHDLSGTLRGATGRVLQFTGNRLVLD